MKNLFLFLFLLVVFTSKAQDNRVSGLNSRQFTKYWKVESESPDYKVTFQGDTAEIVSPKGLTLWRKEKMSGKVTIEYVPYRYETSQSKPDGFASSPLTGKPLA